MHFLRPVLPTTSHRRFDKGAPKASTFRNIIAEQLDYESRVCSGFHSVSHAMEGVQSETVLGWG